MKEKNSSRHHFAPGVSLKSLENTTQRFTPDQASLFGGFEPPTPGAMNDDAAVRAIITECIRKCAKSREEIVDAMARLTGDRVTLPMSNSYTSGAAEQHRWPSQYTRAFCYVVEDWTFFRCIVERAGFHMITPAEADLLELGREMLRQERANEKAALLRKRLQGVDLE